MLFNVLRPNALALFTTDAETLTMMWQTVVLGMGMVFAVLALLFLVLNVFKLVFAGKTPKEPKPVKEKPVEKKAEPASAPAPTPVQQNDGELVAIITAAVAAYMAESGEAVPEGGFRVVSFTRVRGGKPWNSK